MIFFWDVQNCLWDSFGHFWGRVGGADRPEGIDDAGEEKWKRAIFRPKILKSRVLHITLIFMGLPNGSNRYAGCF